MKTKEKLYIGIYSKEIYTLRQIWETHHVVPCGGDFDKLFKEYKEESKSQ